MQMKYKLILLLILSSFFLIGCGSPMCIIVVQDATDDELNKLFEEYSWKEEYLQDKIGRDTFNKIITDEASEVIVHLKETKEVSCDSIKLTSDTCYCIKEKNNITFSSDEIIQLEVFYGNKTFTLLRNSAIIGALTSSIGLLGYIPPNPPQPNWISFVGLFGAGFITGIIFDVSSSSYYCLVPKESLINFIKENQKHNKQNGI